MRIELHSHSYETEANVENLCNNAVAGSVDAVCVPPIYVSAAFERLKKTQITVATWVAGSEDFLETKLAGIDKSCKEGARELVVSIPFQNMTDGCWHLVQAEIFQLHHAAKMYNSQMWVECCFERLTKAEQAKICSYIPDGCGLRMNDALDGDIAMAKLCGVRFICTESTKAPEMGETQHYIFEVPQPEKTTKLYKNGELQ